MSKFHDEFFKKGSAKHDKLVEQTITSIEDIFEDILLPEINGKYFPEPFDTTVFICGEKTIPDYCKINCATAFKNQIACTRKNDDKPVCKYCDISKFNPKNENVKIMNDHCGNDYYCNNDVRRIDTEVYGTSPLVKMVDIEPEMICKNGTFIIGYADIKAAFDLKYQLDCKIDDDWVWKNYSFQTVFVDVIVECKPDLSTWGGPLRQIKTYMNIIRCNNERDIHNDRERRNEKRIVIGLFTTYSVLPEKIKELLKKENIFVATLPKEETVEQPAITEKLF